MKVSLPLSDDEFQAKISVERRSLRAKCEMICASDLLGRNYIVLRPLTTNRGYSLVVDLGTSLSKLQVQPARVGKLLVDLARTSYRTDDWDRTSETHEPLFDGSTFDYLVVVDRDTHDVFYVPAAEVDFKRPTFTVKEADQERYRAI